MAQFEAVRGVLGGGLRLPDGLVAARSLAPEFPLARMNEVMRVAADTFHVLHLHRLPAERLRWVFANAFFHCLRRRDDTLLGIFTLKNFRQVDSPHLERLLAEFLLQAALAVNGSGAPAAAAPRPPAAAPAPARVPVHYPNLGSTPPGRPGSDPLRPR